MPKENRKRGKKHKKTPQNPENEDKEGHAAVRVEERLDGDGQPSWIVSAPKESIEENKEAPFGHLDAEIKAYFRTIDVQLRAWQEREDVDQEMATESDPNEERRMFFVAALTEMSGKEKQLATDPECSIILERMIYSMDDFVRRVFMDSLAGSYEILFRHRFASHVCQTLLTLSANSISRECRGILPSVPESSDHGELLTLSQLVLNSCEEILPSFTSLIMDPYASHVIRALLLVLSPSSSSSSSSKTNATLRSKKSAAWKARQGPLKSVFKGESEDQDKGSSRAIPPEFNHTARKFVQTMKDELSDSEVRALAASTVASHVLQIMLGIEADQRLSALPGSLMDSITSGAITASQDGTSASSEPSDYLNTLLRDPTSSHLLETVIARAPEAAFSSMWSTYFHGKLARLVNHPIANFVVAKAIDRASSAQLQGACAELEGVMIKIVKSSRSGVLRAMIDRAAVLRASEGEIVKVVLQTFDVESLEHRQLLVNCILHLMPYQDYETFMATSGEGESKEPTIQGAILLQSLLRLSHPHNQPIVDSILSMSIDELLTLSRHSTSSRILDAFIESSTVPFKAKRKLVLSFIGHYHVLVDDRIGSRVGDRFWAFADTYLKEKIARSLIPHEQTLAGSFYGKFFARNLNLYLLQRRPEEWKTMQAERKRVSQEHTITSDKSTSEQPKTIIAERASSVPKKRKNEARPKNEIDLLFEGSLGKKMKKGTLGVDPVESDLKVKSASGSKDDLSSILGAIRAAPKEKEAKRQRKR